MRITPELPVISWCCYLISNSWEVKIKYNNNVCISLILLNNSPGILCGMNFIGNIILSFTIMFSFRLWNVLKCSYILNNAARIKIIVRHIQYHIYIYINQTWHNKTYLGIGTGIQWITDIFRQSISDKMIIFHEKREQQQHTQHDFSIQIFSPNKHICAPVEYYILHLVSVVEPSQTPNMHPSANPERGSRHTHHKFISVGPGSGP